MIKSGTAPDSGTCRALSECFGENNIELAADLVEAAESERVEFLLSKGIDVASSPFSASSLSAAAASVYRPSESLSFPPARAPPTYLKQREWSLYPVLEPDERSFVACQGVSSISSSSSSSSSSSFSPSLPPPLVLDLHGMSRSAARVVLLVSLRCIVAAAAEPGKNRAGIGGVWGRLTRSRRKRIGEDEKNGDGAAVPGGIVLVVGRSGIASPGVVQKKEEEEEEEEEVGEALSRNRRRRQRRRRRARELAGGSGGGSEEAEEDGDGDGDGGDEAATFAAARVASRAAATAAHFGVAGGINASVLSFATQHLGLPASLDPRNEGRLVVTAEDLDLWVLAELESRRRASTGELASKQALTVAAVASSAFGFWWVVPKLLAI